jgi:pimeloyl-ACP methyl ester carboxylesterase
MYFFRRGKGDWGIVGFHGWSGDHHTFDPLLDQIPEGYAFYALDLPGCGKSGLPQEWEMRSLAREVALELIGLNRQGLTLVGSCSGAIMTAFVARELIQMEKKDWVRRLVMIDPFAFCPWYFQLFLIPVMGPLMYATAFANPVGRGITNLFLWDKRAGHTHLTRDFAGVNHWVVWKYLKMLSECGRPAQFRGLDLPVDIVYGEKTFSAVRKSVLEWREALPQSRIAKLKEVGHLPISEGTKQVAEVVFQGAKV